MFRRKLLPILTLGLTVLSLAVLGQGSDRPQATTQPVASAGPELKDVDGASRHPLDVRGAAGAVVIFIASDCPISNGYAPEINRICTQFGGEGADKFRFYLVHVDPDLTAADAKAHAKEHGFDCPVLMDGKRILCKDLAAKVTPEAFVIGEGGAVLYRGRIDNKWAGYLKSRTEATTHDLRTALDAILAGKPVPVAKTEVVGCPIG